MKLPILSAWLLFASLTFGVFSLSAQEKSNDPLPPHFPLLWKVADKEGNSKGYLFGTIHLADPRVANFPKSVSEAVESCDVVVTELKMDQKTMAEAGLRSFVQASEKDLHERLPAETVKHLDDELKLISPMLGVKTPPFNRMKIWTAMATLPMLEAVMEYPGMPSVDEKIVAIGRNADLTEDALETVDEQLGVFEGIADERMIEMLDITLEGMRKARTKGGVSPTEELILAYRRGDIDEIEAAADWDSEFFGRPEPEVSKEVMTALLETRNKRMGERVLDRYKESPEKKFFVAVGTLHLPGETGLVDHLTKAGYVVERVPAPVAAEVK